MINHRRIVQILPAPQGAYVLFLADRPDSCSVSPVVCLALVDRWESAGRYDPAPENAAREVLPMIAVEGTIDIPDDALNYEGYYEQDEALKLLHERLSELCSRDAAQV